MMSQFKGFLVEEGRLSRQVFKELLHTRFQSLDIYEAENEEKALRITGSTPPDLIFIDIRLCEANGLDLIKRMKARHPKIVSLVFTTYDAEYLEAAGEYTDYYLSKRPTNEDVFALIESILLTKAQHRTRKSIFVG